MGYRDYAKQVDTSLQTGIHTRINKNLRVSSCFRKFSNSFFESWAWETFLWNGEKIEKQYNLLESADLVIDLHTQVVNEYGGDINGFK